MPTGMNHSLRRGGPGKGQDEHGEEGKQHKPITRRPDLQEPHTVGDANLPPQFGRADLIERVTKSTQNPLRRQHHRMNQVLIEERLVLQEILVGHIHARYPTKPSPRNRMRSRSTTQTLNRAPDSELLLPAPDANHTNANSPSNQKPSLPSIGMHPRGRRSSGTHLSQRPLCCSQKSSAGRSCTYATVSEPQLTQIVWVMVPQNGFLFADHDVTAECNCIQFDNNLGNVVHMNSQLSNHGERCKTRFMNILESKR